MYTSTVLYLFNITVHYAGIGVQVYACTLLYNPQVLQYHPLLASAKGEKWLLFLFIPALFPIQQSLTHLPLSNTSAATPP
jgi:hypothetical protein